jgi:hypothetical protein
MVVNTNSNILSYTVTSELGETLLLDVKRVTRFPALEQENRKTLLNKFADVAAFLNDESL